MNTQSLSVCSVGLLASLALGCSSNMCWSLGLGYRTNGEDVWGGNVHYLLGKGRKGTLQQMVSYSNDDDEKEDLDLEERIEK